MPKQSPRRTHAERRDVAARCLLDAGVALVAEAGFDALTLADVGAAAGYSRGLLGHYFGSKEAFRDALIDYIMSGMKDIFLVEPPSFGLDILTGILENYVLLSGKDPTTRHIMQIMLSDHPGKPPLLQQMLSPVRQAAFGLYERHIRAGIENGAIRPDADPVFMTQMVASAVSSALRIAVSNHDADLKSIGQQLVLFIIWGLASSELRLAR